MPTITGKSKTGLLGAILMIGFVCTDKPSLLPEGYCRNA